MRIVSGMRILREIRISVGHKKYILFVTIFFQTE